MDFGDDTALTPYNLTIRLGTYSLTIEGSSFLRTGGKYIYLSAGENNKKEKIIFDLGEKKFSVSVSVVDFSDVRRPLVFSLQRGEESAAAELTGFDEYPDNAAPQLNEVSARKKICKARFYKNITGGCKVRLAEPNNCSGIKLPYVFGWTTGGSYCETPWKFQIAGNPPKASNYYYWNLS